jgi:hypothetical protein
LPWRVDRISGRALNYKGFTLRRFGRRQQSSIAIGHKRRRREAEIASGLIKAWAAKSQRGGALNRFAELKPIARILGSPERRDVAAAMAG